MQHLLEHFKDLTLHPKNAQELKGLFLKLAVQGKLTSQWRKENPDVESASFLLEKIDIEKEQLFEEKKIKKEKQLPPVAKKEFPYEIPKTWEWSRLPNLFFGLGNRYNQVNTNEYQNEGRFPIVDQGKNFITGFSDLEQKVLKLDNPVIVFGDHTRHVKYIDFDFIIGADGTKILRPYKAIFPEFFYHQLCSYDLTNRGYGRHFKILKEMFFSIPPLEEQKAIVATVNQLFAEVELLEAATKKRIQLKEDFVTSGLRRLSTEDTTSAWGYLLPHFKTFFTEKSSIKKLRESILQLAVQGKLTRAFRESHPELCEGTHSAEALLERIKAEKAKLIKEGKIKKEKPLPAITEDEIPYELPESWVWSNIQSVCTKVTDGFHHTPQKLELGYKYISATHVKENGILWDDCLFIGKKEHSELFKKASPKKGDILIVNRGAGCGTPALVDIDEPFSFQNAALIGFNQSMIHPSFMNNFILQKRTEIMDLFTNGGAQPMLSNKILKTIIFPFPPIDEQKAIVDKVNALMALCDRLEKEIETQKTTQEEWMQSCLREIFEK